MFAPDNQPPDTNLVYYQIKVIGDLHNKWSDWFSGLKIESERQSDGSKITILKGAIKDQAALRGILSKLLDLNLVLISVQQIPPPQDNLTTTNQ